MAMTEAATGELNARWSALHFTLPPAHKLLPSAAASGISTQQDHLSWQKLICANDALFLPLH